MEFRELRALAINLDLLAHHQVWQSGDGERKKAGSVMGLIPPKKREPSAPPPSDLSDANPYATPKVRTIADGPPGGLYLPHLHRSSFPVFFLALLITCALFYGGWQVKDPDTKPILFSLAGFSLIFWLALATIYLHRAWSMMHMFGAQLTGGKAVRFLFFPIFNALWCFVTLYGWAKLWNQSVRTHPGLSLASKIWQPFFFLFPILFLISQGLIVMHLFIREWPTDLKDTRHLTSLGIWLAFLVTGLICWGQMCQSINFLARKKS